MYAMTRSSPQTFAFQTLLSLLLAMPALNFSAQTVSPRQNPDVLWSGNPGLTESVSKIMERQSRKPKPSRSLGPMETHPRLLHNPANQAVAMAPPIPPASASSQVGDSPRGPFTPQTVATSFLGAQISDTAGY